MAGITIATLPVVPVEDRETAEVLDVLHRFVTIAEQDGLREVLVVAIGRDDQIIMGASGQVGVTSQIGAIERFKAHLLTLAASGDG